MTDDQQAAHDRHTEDSFVCTDPHCMFPVQPATWCTR